MSKIYKGNHSSRRLLVFKLTSKGQDYLPGYVIFQRSQQSKGLFVEHRRKSVSNQNKQLVSGTVKEIGQVGGGDSVSGLGVKAKNIRRPTSANEVVCEECCCYNIPAIFLLFLAGGCSDGSG